MKYELINQRDPSLNVVGQILVNRGIKHADLNHYLHTTQKDMNSPFDLKNMESAVRLVEEHINNGHIFIQVDSDVDGFTSASMLYNYIKLYNKDAKVSYRVHPVKEHGVKLHYLEELEDYPTLVIIPDAGSDQLEEHKCLSNMGIECVVLDHHEVDRESEYAIVVNNQSCDYSNKNLSGAGIVYQFCRAFDEIFNINNADEFVDLAAIGCVADMVDVRDFETRYLINKGINNINNALILSLIEKQSYSLKDGVTPLNISFYVAPLINAVIRVGTLEEKTKMFESMLDENKNLLVASTKRGFNGMEESLIEQVSRESGNIKNRQTRLRDSGLEEIEKIILKNNLDKNKIILVKTDDILEKSLTGLVANQLMFKYQKPVLLLRGTSNENLEGSARGYDKSELNELRKFLLESGYFEYAKGHQCAFGCGIKGTKVDEFIEYSNKALAELDFDPRYLVDFVFSSSEVTHADILDIAGLANTWGKGMEESEILIKGIRLTTDNITLLEKGPTLKLTPNNGITYIKFKCPIELYNSLKSEGYVLVDIIGRCSVNNFNGAMEPQVIISDIEVVEKVNYYF